MRKVTMEDIEALDALRTAISKIKQHEIEIHAELAYPVSIKKETARLKFKLGIMSANMDTEMGLKAGSTDLWTVKYKPSESVAGQVHGSGIRYDIPTKCLVVKRCRYRPTTYVRQRAGPRRGRLGAVRRVARPLVAALGPVLAAKGLPNCHGRPVVRG